jgi:hypothetical protein
VRASNLLPAGVVVRLNRTRRRIAAALEGVPLLFVGIVLGVTLLFRLGIGALRPALPDAAAAAPKVAPHERPAPAATPALDLRPEPGVETARTAAAAAVRPFSKPAPRARPAAPRRKPRTHGRR